MMDAISTVSTRTTGTETTAMMDAVMTEMEEALFLGRRKTHNSNFTFIITQYPLTKEQDSPPALFLCPFIKTLKLINCTVERGRYNSINP